MTAKQRNLWFRVNLSIVPDYNRSAPIPILRIHPSIPLSPSAASTRLTAIAARTALSLHSLPSLPTISMSTPPDPAAAAAAMVTSTATATAHIAPKADADANVNGDPQALPPHHPELTSTDTYQVDSSEFDSGSDAESLPEEEYDALVQEGARADGPTRARPLLISNLTC